MNALPRLVAALAVTLMTIAAGTAEAQAPAGGYEILIMPGATDSSTTEQEFADLVEESAWVTQDFGGFAVTRWYQMEERVGAATANAALACIDDVTCYVETLYNTPYAYVLVVSVFRSGTGFSVEYRSIDVRAGTLGAETYAALATPASFAALPPACHPALQITPQWRTPTPVATPTPAPAPAPVLPPPPPERDRPPLGGLGRAGAYTAASGAALLSGGLLLGFAADETQQEIQASPHERSDLRSLQSRGERQQRMANVAFGLGGAALATGITLVIVDRVQAGGDDVAPQWSFRVSPNGVGFGGRF